MPIKSQRMIAGVMSGYFHKGQHLPFLLRHHWVWQGSSDLLSHAFVSSRIFKTVGKSSYLYCFKRLFSDINICWRPAGLLFSHGPCSVKHGQGMLRHIPHTSSEGTRCRNTPVFSSSMSVLDKTWKNWNNSTPAENYQSRDPCTCQWWAGPRR